MTAGVSAKVLLLLAEGFEDLEAATILDVCGWTEYRDQIPTVHVTTAGIRARVRGRFGLVVEPDLLIGEVRPEDYGAIALPGGFRGHGYEEIYDERVYEILRTIHTRGGWIATLCVGVLPVAEAGLLAGRRGTTYPFSRHDNRAQLRDAGALVVDDPIVSDHRIISCQGPAQSIAVALLLLEGLIGEQAASEVRRYLMCEAEESA